MISHIAITGGIGAGKSYVCRLLEKRGIRIYDCDANAKRLMNDSVCLRQKLTDLIGPDAYLDGRLNKAVVARFLLASESNKIAINSIVHPAVIEDFYSSGLQWMESAILFEAHLQHTVDYIVCVTAPKEIRVRRVMERDGITAEKACEWIDCQMPQEKVAEMCDAVVLNDGMASLDMQIDSLLDGLSRI